MLSLVYLWNLSALLSKYRYIKNYSDVVKRITKKRSELLLVCFERSKNSFIENFVPFHEKICMCVITTVKKFD